MSLYYDPFEEEEAAIAQSYEPEKHMTTKSVKPDYVSDVEHEVGCRHQWDKSLYLMRKAIEVQPLYVAEHALWSDDQWKLDDVLEPVTLCCTGCNATKYVHIDDADEIVRLTPETCTRNMGHHITNWKKPCEYCGYHGEKV